MVKIVALCFLIFMAGVTVGIFMTYNSAFKAYTNFFKEKGML